MPLVSVIHGPNLNLLGIREPEIYGHESLVDIDRSIVELGAELGLDIECFQSNHEGILIDRVQSCRERADAVLLNAGGYTHTSVALRDACAELRAPLIEVHISNVHTREEFRHHSYLSAVATGVIVGLGVQGYVLALRYLASLS